MNIQKSIFFIGYYLIVASALYILTAVLETKAPHPSVALMILNGVCAALVFAFGTVLITGHKFHVKQRPR